MSRRYIDADKLIKSIEKRRLIFKDTITVAEALESQGKVIREEIENAPTADAVEVRHGEWGFDGIGWTCSECDGYAIDDVKSDWCPHCGAKMDGEKTGG